MKVAVIGSRSFVDSDILTERLDAFHAISPITLVISGGARGADSLAEAWAKKKGIATKIFYPDWEKHGKRAGFLRNQDICEEADHIIAFWDGESKGTKHSLNLSKNLGKQVTINYI